MIFKIVLAIVGIILASLGVWKLYDNEQLNRSSEQGAKEQMTATPTPAVPFYFEENKGQVDEQVKFLAKSGASTPCDSASCRAP